MTVIEMTRTHTSVRNLIDEAIAEHGAMRVLLSALKAVIRDRALRRERPPDVRRLDTRMRRDIGLLPDFDRPEGRFFP